MNEGARLSLPMRVVTRALGTFGRLAYGNAQLVVQQEMIASLGVRRYVRLIRQAIAIIRVMNERFGEAQTQFLIGMTAMWNGCGFCSYGHVLTGSLLVYRDQGTLHPLHPRVIERLIELEPDRSIEALAELLREHPDLRERVSRLNELRSGRARPETVDDYVLDACRQIWTQYVEYTIVAGLTMKPDEAICPAHPIGRDEKLIARYRRARERERERSVFRH